jgi:RNA polymerase sigma-70 factor (ECF subfamily)
METNVMIRGERTDLYTEQVIALFEAYHEPIYAYLYRLVGEVEWAHDLTQDTFLRLFETKQRLPEVENQRAWVYRIASNLAFNALKRRRRFQWLPWQAGDAWQRTAQLAPSDPAEKVAEGSQVARALTSLSPDYRAPLLLYSQYDFSVREVAVALKISESAVKTRLFRAREMFRQAYEENQTSKEVR